MKNKMLKYFQSTIKFVLVLVLCMSLFPKTVFGATSEIFYDNSISKWEKVYIYYWGTTGPAWPGTEMTPVVGKDNIYSFTLPDGATAMIFNNENKGEQSTDIVDIQSGSTYVSLGIEGGKHVVMKKDASGNIPGEPDPSTATDITKAPKQVNVHVGSDYSNVNLTFTTVAKVDTKVTVKKSGDIIGKDVVGSNKFSLLAFKYFNTIKITDLEASTKYIYTIGQGQSAYTGSFTTAPKLGSSDSFKFAYIADPQVSNDINAKALGATFNELNKISNLGFVYIAGDLTDNSTAEKQWEYLFENSGKFPKSGQDMFGNNMISVAQGNHDISTFTGHINAPAQAGEAVYSYDYGNAKFIMLNLESAKKDEVAREAQKAFLEKQVKEAKDAGQWTIVGFHKSIYTGASHISDGDVIEARKYWGPTLANLDVDLVLMGHDHVYSRGFITAEGVNAKLAKNDAGSYSSKDNVPLYKVGGHAGGLKWYSKNPYTVSLGDPLTPNYEFLDKNSTDDGSDIKKEQTYTIFEISKDAITLNSYNLKYDTDKDEITTEKYLYDTLKLERQTYKASLPVVEGAIFEETENSNSMLLPGESFSFTVKLDNNFSDSKIKVKANGIELNAVNGIYTVKNINEDMKITVGGIVANLIPIIPSNEIPLTNNTVAEQLKSTNVIKAANVKKTDLPKTADENIPLIVSILLVASLGACIFIAKKKKKTA